MIQTSDKKILNLPLCECGCGGKVKKPHHRYIHGHNRRGCEPWNTGLTKETHPSLAAASEKLKGIEPWNIGLTKETDSRLAAISNKMKGCKIWNTGLTKEIHPSIASQAAKLAIKMMGQGNHQYIDGLINRAHPNFTVAFKQKIRERDNYRCRMCKQAEKPEIRLLDIHHIYYDPEDNDCSNDCDFISLCRSCHAKTSTVTKREYYTWIFSEYNCVWLST